MQNFAENYASSERTQSLKFNFTIHLSFSSLSHGKMRLMTSTMAMITRKLSNFFFFFFFKLQTTNAELPLLLLHKLFINWSSCCCYYFFPFRQTETEERAQRKNFGPKQPCSRKSKLFSLTRFELNRIPCSFLPFFRRLLLLLHPCIEFPYILFGVRCVRSGAVCGNKPVEMIERRKKIVTK